MIVPGLQHQAEWNGWLGVEELCYYIWKRRLRIVQLAWSILLVVRERALTRLRELQM